MGPAGGLSGSTRNEACHSRVLYFSRMFGTYHHFNTGQRASLLLAPFLTYISLWVCHRTPYLVASLQTPQHP